MRSPAAPGSLRTTSSGALLRRCVAGLLLPVLLLLADTHAAEPAQPLQDGWAFQPLSAVSIPTPPGRVAANPVDAFLQKRLADRGLTPGPLASPRERLRRLHFDLLGLPPTPEEVAAFERDPSPEAWSRCVEDLLARPQYGERWGRHWLDVVRFAQSNGYERDSEKLHAWRYRDYVIRAFNQDKPYDQFVREQIAGDELAAGDGLSAEARQDALIATGFLRLGVHDDEPDDKLQAEFDELDDMVSTSSTAFLGLTVGCARCHDHKFDPIPQQDYYSLLAVFRPMKIGGTAEPSLDSPLFAPLAGPEQVAEWKSAQDRRRRDLEAKISAESAEDRKKALRKELDALGRETPPFEWALAARERPDAVPVVHVLSRGNPRSPGAEVRPGFLRAAGGGDAKIHPVAGAAPPTSGRRTAFADWIVSPANPLTARVMVNRIWHHHFGRGIVRTTADFGRVGSRPTHPELLDWLAGEFMRMGWSIKGLHRLILHSAAWNQSSGADRPTEVAADPANELLWRQNLRRLDAESLRDSLLAISGRLNFEAGGRGFFPALSGEVLAGGSRPGTDWQVSPPDQTSRRSVYTYIRRTSMVPLLEAFDYSNATSPLTERPSTTVAPQALMLLNDAFVQEQAAALAARAVREFPEGPEESQLRRIWTLATSRAPDADERRQLRDYWDRQTELWSGLEERMVFRPDVPDTLSVPYFQSLPASRFLVGPEEGWRFHKGLWPREYEGNRALEPGRGPFALWTGASVSNGIVEVEVLPQAACTQVGILWRASTPKGDGVESGYELVLEPREDRILLRRLDAARSTELAASTGAGVRNGRTKLRIAIEGDRISVSVGDHSSPILEAHDSAGPTSGQLGVRAWGAAVSLNRFQWTPASGGPPVPLWTALPRGWARHRALEGVCLLVMNLNEVSYVD